MIKFSRAGWNNVIIFAVMGFILLINATHDNVFYSAPTSKDEISVLGENSVVLTLTINQQFKVERIGKTWRASPSHINGQALEQMMFAWQQAEGRVIEEPLNIDKQLGLIVNVDLAGEVLPLVLSLHITDTELLIYNHKQSLWISLSAPLFPQLIPSIIFE